MENRIATFDVPEDVYIVNNLFYRRSWPLVRVIRHAPHPWVGRRFWDHFSENNIIIYSSQLAPIKFWGKAARRLLAEALFTLLCLFIIQEGAMAKPAPQDEYERQMVIETILGEAADQGLDGMTAVAETIRNRTTQRGLPASKVVLQPKQFSFWNDTPAAKRWLTKNVTPEAYQAAMHAYERAFNEGSQITKGATHYYNPAKVKKTPTFAKLYEPKGRIGEHEFFYGA